MICVSGMLLIASMAFNPELITAFKVEVKTSVTEVFIYSTSPQGWHRFTVPEALPYGQVLAIYETWYQCRKEFTLHPTARKVP